MGPGMLDDRRRFAWLGLGAAIVAAAGSLVDTRGTVWPALMVVVALFALNALVPRFSAVALLVGTATIVTALNWDLRAEGAFFLVCVAVMVLTSSDSNRRRAHLLAGASVLTPAIDRAGNSEVLREWNWPFWSMGILLTWLLGAVLYRQRRLTQALADAQEQLAAQAALDERRRIARDLHDVVGHSLTVVLLHLSGARRLIRRDPDEAEAALTDAERVGRQSLADIRRVVSLLRDDEADGRQPAPAAADIPGLIDRCRAAGMVVTEDLSPALTDLDPATGLALYRIVQEALANAARHARGAPVAVRVGIDDEQIVAEVADRGGPGRPTTPEGNGLLGMRERAVALGGTVTAGAGARGWTVTARLPRNRTPRPSPEWA